MTGRARPEQASPGDPPGDTHVWVVDLAASAAALVTIDQTRRLLTEPERLRAERMVDTRIRERWIAAHAALHLALSSYIGHPVQFEPIGDTAKPRVVDWHGDFSLSHSGTLALIALREHGQVGIDVELRRAARLSAERRQLIEVAGAALLPDSPLPSGDPEMSFLAAWTRLEAISKMRAMGIGALLEALGIVAKGPGPEAVAERAKALIADTAQPMSLCSIDVAHLDAVASLAMSPPAGTPHLHDLDLSGA
jgi:4'-phosphopantetheinyl transferase